jgi:hypothetical protein
MVTCLKIAALLHLGLIWAGIMMPRVIKLSTHLASLPVMVRQLYWVYYSFIGFILVSFGALTWIHADAMAAGIPVARSLSAVMAVFWVMRCAVAGMVFDLRPYLTSKPRCVGKLALDVVFLYLTAVYGWTAVKHFL